MPDEDLSRPGAGHRGGGPGLPGGRDRRRRRVQPARPPLSVLLLAHRPRCSLAGARLGAISDVVPQSRFEPDPGPEPEIDPLHDGLANALEGIDDYGEIFDPIIPGGVVHGSLSGDLAEIAARPGPRPAPLRGRPDRRGAVVVAVQLPVLVGAAGGERAAGRPVDPGTPAAGRRRRGRRGRRVRRSAPPVDCCRPVVQAGSSPE